MVRLDRFLPGDNRRQSLLFHLFRSDSKPSSSKRIGSNCAAVHAPQLMNSTASCGASTCRSAPPPPSCDVIVVRSGKTENEENREYTGAQAILFKLLRADRQAREVYSIVFGQCCGCRDCFVSFPRRPSNSEISFRIFFSFIRM